MVMLKAPTSAKKSLFRTNGASETPGDKSERSASASLIKNPDTWTPEVLALRTPEDAHGSVVAKVVRPSSQNARIALVPVGPL